jgi:hypothetical protein
MVARASVFSSSILFAWWLMLLFLVRNFLNDSAIEIRSCQDCHFFRDGCIISSLIAKINFLDFTYHKLFYSLIVHSSIHANT